jgi:hypothetical protein
MSSKHKRQERQRAKAVALKPFANPEVEDDRHAAVEEENEEDFLPQVCRPSKCDGGRKWVLGPV